MIVQLAIAVIMLTAESQTVAGAQIASYGGVPIDVEIGQERAEGGNWVVNNCSTQSVQCLSGYYYRLAMPRDCTNLSVGDSFKGGSVQTDVIWQAPRNAANLPFFNGPIMIVGSPDRRWIVYVYSATTLSAIYVDFDHSRDLYSAAQQSGLAGIKALETVPNRMLLPLETIRGIMECPINRQ